MSLAQKWGSILGALGALYLIAMHPDAFVKAGTALKNLTAGSVVSVTTGGAK
jgi:hypothetical protein